MLASLRLGFTYTGHWVWQNSGTASFCGGGNVAACGRLIKCVKAGDLVFVHRLKICAPAISRQFMIDMGEGGMGLQMLAHGQHDPAIHSCDPVKAHLLQDCRAQVRQQGKRDMAGAKAPGHHLDGCGKGRCREGGGRGGQKCAVPFVRCRAGRYGRLDLDIVAKDRVYSLAIRRGVQRKPQIVFAQLSVDGVTYGRSEAVVLEAGVPTTIGFDPERPSATFGKTGRFEVLLVGTSSVIAAADVVLELPEGVSCG